MVARNARTPDWKEQCRWRALDLKRDGWTHHEIAEALEVTKGAVSQWMARVAREGEEALLTFNPRAAGIPTDLAGDSLFVQACCAGRNQCVTNPNCEDKGNTDP